MGAIIHAYFNALKALKASSESNTCSDFLLVPSPAKCLLRWLCNVCKPFDELPVVAHQTKKGMHLGVSLRWHALCNCFQVQATGPHPILWDAMCQIGDFFSKTLHFNGFNFRLCSLNQLKMICKQWGCSSAAERRWLCHQGRWGNMLDSAPQDNFALATERWLVHCTVQKACSYTWRSLNC